MNVFNNINLGTTQPNIACVNAAESYCLYRVDSSNDSNNDCIKKHIESVVLIKLAATITEMHLIFLMILIYLKFLLINGFLLLFDVKITIF